MVAVGGLRGFNQVTGVNAEISARVSRKEDCAGRLSLLSGRTQLTLAGESIEDITRDYIEGDRRKVLCRRSG
jgi:hypothetical protein